MTLAQNLKISGINVETELGDQGAQGTTKSGKNFYMARACGAYGTQYTLSIDGNTVATHCLYRTAVQKIKNS